MLNRRFVAKARHSQVFEREAFRYVGGPPNVCAVEHVRPFRMVFLRLTLSGDFVHEFLGEPLARTISRVYEKGEMAYPCGFERLELEVPLYRRSIITELPSPTSDQLHGFVGDFVEVVPFRDGEIWQFNSSLPEDGEGAFGHVRLP